MPEWIETYRGVVSAWECDIVEHFTIAYYFEKLQDATRNFVELIGESELLGHGVGTAPSRIVAIFQHELRAGAAFHMTSGVIGLDGHALRLGHRIIDSTSGQTVTWVAETLTMPIGVSNETMARIGALTTKWPGPEVPAETPLPVRRGALTARDRVKPKELDEAGRLSLSDHVHRFSGAGMHFLTSVGLSGEYMRINRRGFSTFLLDVHLVSAALQGERIDVHTVPAHLGTTSLRYVHRMTGSDGREIASMVQAGVQLDLDARRPTAMPAEIRDRITAQLTGP
ncbi:MAG: thioesterase family protein [Hyphomicrobiaceae bacterium]|nr:thioesterase family protein [Hyphomicrobiaceae bacterium]